MAGNPAPATSGDLAYFLVLALSLFAYVTFPITLGLYVYRIYWSAKRAKSTDT